MINISIVFPVHNEEETLEVLLTDWYEKLNKNKIDFEFVIVEDGSKDRTKEIIKYLEKKFPIINLSQNERRGYSKAVMEGIKNSTKNYILCTDSDGQIKVESLLENLINLPKENEFLIGYRNPRKDPWNRIIYSKAFKIFHDILFHSNLRDPSCPFVLGLRETFVSLPEKQLIETKEAFWWGFVAVSLNNNKKFFEKPIQHFKRDGGEAGYKLKNLFGIIVKNTQAMFKIKNYK